MSRFLIYNYNSVIYIMTDNVNEILEYINTDDLKKLNGFKLIKNMKNINKGGVIRYINKKNYKFNNGGIVIENKKDYRLIKILNYSKTNSWHIYFDENLIYYKKKLTYRELMINMVNGFKNNAVKITKV